MPKYIIRSEQIRGNASSAVSKLAREPLMVVTIEEYKEDKSAQQRGFWHVLIGIMAEELGYTKSQMKSVLKQEILGVETVEFNGKEKTIEPSSEDEKRKGYSVLIDQTIMIAAEQGIQLPDPRGIA